MAKLLGKAILSVVCGLIACGVAQAQRAGSDREFNGRFGTGAASVQAESTDRIIVKWRSNARTLAAADVDLAELAGRSGIRVQRLRAIGNGMQVLRLDREQSADEMTATLQRLRADPNVEVAEPDRRLHAHALVPNDPLFIGQWYLQALQPAAIRSTDAWSVSTGGSAVGNSGTVIAVIDTGVRFEHPDLLRAAAGGKLLPGYDFVSSDTPGNFTSANDGDGWDSDPSDPGDFITSAELQLPIYRNRSCGTTATASSWHGTRVAGLIAANTNNGLGIAGGAFNAWVLPIRALGKCGGFDSDILAAMYWAAGLPIPSFATGNQTVPPTNPYPANVINMSLGATGVCSGTYAAAVTAISQRGVLIVASAGNEGAATDTPANCPGVLGVGGLRHVGTKVGYSNLGPEVAVSAPAGNCVNTTVGSPCLFSLDTTSNSGTTIPTSSDYTNQINSNVGTSFSAPLVAATVGLMHELNGRLSPALLITRLRESASPFPTASDTTPAPPVCHTPTSTTDKQDTECICTTAVCGAGMLNAGAAAAAARRPVAIVAAPVSSTLPSGVTAAVTSPTLLEGNTCPTPIFGQSNPVAPTPGTPATPISPPAPAGSVTLDGSASSASCGRTVASYLWTIISGTGVVSAPAAPVTSIVAPSSGTLALRLTVTDNLGASDTTTLTLQGPAPVVQAAPPASTSSSGGGGSWGRELVVVGGIVAISVVRRRRSLRNAPLWKACILA